MTDKEYSLSDDAECIYNGEATVKNYGASSSKQPYIGFTGLDINQFDYILNNVDPNTEVQCVMADGDTVLRSESMQFKSAYDNSSDKWIKLCFDQDQSKIEATRNSIGNKVSLYLFLGQIHERPTKEKGDHGKYASQLIQSQIMIHPTFWSVVGTEEKYLDWLRGNPCMLTGGWVESESGDKRVEAAHVRDIKYGAGIAKKPEYFAIPLHPKIHAEQHEKGIYNMWKKAGRPTPSQVQYPITNQADHIRQWLVISTLEYIKKWIQFELKEYFGVSSMSFISPDNFEQYVTDKCAPEVVQQILKLSKTKRDLSFLAGLDNGE